MKRIFFAFVMIPFLAKTQFAHTNFKKSSDSGIQWTEGLDWEKIKAKAKSENKFIFIDCYASWCGPCKMMDKSVYTSEKIGKIANEKLISVKIQFDSTSNEGDNVYWFRIAKMLEKKYNIVGYPTFLFFSPEGEISHRDIGYKTIEQFMAVLRVALDPKEDYSQMLAKYQSGERNIKDMRRLALKAKSSDEKLAIKIAEDYVNTVSENTPMTRDDMELMVGFTNSPVVKKRIEDYKSNYLDKLDNEKLFSADNLHFITKFSFVVNSKDKFFRLFYEESKRMDSISGVKGFSDKLVRNVIKREEIYSVLFNHDNKPAVKKANWRKIKSNITKKYSKNIAESLVAEVQPIFYKMVRDWKNYSSYFDKKIKEIPPRNNDVILSPYGNAWGLNGAAWDVFRFCNNKKILKKALRWIDVAIELDAQASKVNSQYLDTKANLMYKLNMVEEAIKQEQQAIEMHDNEAKESGKNIGPLHTVYINTIDKMKRGEPTWP